MNVEVIGGEPHFETSVVRELEHRRNGQLFYCMRSKLFHDFVAVRGYFVLRY